MGWQEAKKAAWAKFGRRYWKLIVGVELARKFGPGLLAGLTVAALAAFVWWLVSHAPSPTSLTAHIGVPDLDVPGRWWWWLIGVAALAAVVLLTRRHDPLAAPLRYRPAAIAARIVAVLAAAGAVLLVLVTRDA